MNTHTKETQTPETQTPETKKSFLGKLNYIQANLNAPKTQFNKFGKFHYRSCEDILGALKPLLTQMKCVLTVSDEIFTMDSRFYVKATATLFDTETSDNISVTGYAREAEQKKGADVSQVTGATSTYARKYSLNGLFAIDDSKDADHDSGKQEQQKQQPRRPQPPKPSFQLDNRKPAVFFKECMEAVAKLKDPKEKARLTSQINGAKFDETRLVKALAYLEGL